MKLHCTREGWFLQTAAGVVSLGGFDLDLWLARNEPVEEIKSQASGLPLHQSALPSQILPVGSQEIWAAGVTYLRSKAARMEESDFSASAYDRVYEAPRPELFFKATPARCAASGEPLKLREDSKWMVPEPELTLVVSASGRVVGYTLGNDLSCRDIEGDNTLYLPQAKVWDKCCGLGPCILIDDGTVDIRASTIHVEIIRGGKPVFAGSTPISRIKRSFEELIGYLFRHQTFSNGVFLLTGTGIVPPDDFTLQRGDRVRIWIDEIGELMNVMD